MLVKWPELTMTLDKQGAVAVCNVECQQSLDRFEEEKMCKCIGEILGNLREMKRDAGRASSKEKLGDEKGSKRDLDPRRDLKHESVTNQEHTE